MEQVTTKPKSAEADNERGMFAPTASGVSQAEIEHASALFASRLSRLDGLGLVVDVRLNGLPFCSVDASDGAARIGAFLGDRPARITVDTTPRYFQQLLDNEMEPRTAIQFGYMEVRGDPKLAIKFGDALNGTVDDRLPPMMENLPQPTTDIALAMSQFREFGYCIVKDVLSPEEVAAVRARMIEQAAVEKELGIAMLDGGEGTPNQRLWALINKGVEFEQMLEKDIVHQFGEEFLGEGFIMGSISGNIAGPGGEPQTLHYDQMVFQPSMDFMAGINIGWFLDDVTDLNGGTRLIPGSHRARRGPDDPYGIEGTIAAEGPAGSVIIWDSRLWHGTGPNRTNEKRHVIISVFYRYFLRANQNYSLLLAPEVEARLSDRQKSLLGFRVTGRLGTLEDVREGVIVSRPAKPLGPLYYSDIPQNRNQL